MNLYLLDVPEGKPNLQQTVKKTLLEISDLNFGLPFNVYPTNTLSCYSINMLEQATARRIDYCEFSMAIFEPEERMYFLLCLIQGFKDLLNNWKYEYLSKTPGDVDIDQGLKKIVKIHKDFTKWADENLHAIGSGSYQSVGLWF